MLIEYVKSSARYLISALALIMLQCGAVAVADDAATCMLSTQPFADMHKQRIRLVGGTGNVLEFRTRIANESAERSAGYQHICPEVIDITSILFVYDTEVDTSFHMFNVFGALDIGFFNAAGELVSVQTMVPQKSDDPDAKYYYSTGPYKYVLEIRPGYFKENQLTVGTTHLSLE